MTTEEMVQRVAEMHGISLFAAAKEIKLLLDLGTVTKEKRPFAEGRSGNKPTDIIHEIGA